MPPTTRSATLIVGSSGGIGAALCSELAQRDPNDVLLRTTRHPGNSDAIPLDLEQPTSFLAAAETVRRILQAQHAQLRRILICSGTLHDTKQQPERRLQDLDSMAFQRVMNVNALGPLLVAQAFLPLLPRREQTIFAAISARVGSISDNRLGGWYSYRCSKAALNMGLRTLAHELRRTHPGCTPLAYHPGTVTTALSAPFVQSTAASKTLSPEQAARYFADVIESRSGSCELAYVDWKNEPIDW